MLKAIKRLFRPRACSDSHRARPRPPPPTPADPKLPVELLHQVFSHADIEDLITIGQVCNAWRRVASSPQFVLPLLQPLVPSLVLPDDHQALLQMLGRQLRIQNNRVIGRYSVTELPMDVGNTLKVHMWFTDDNRHAVTLAESDCDLWKFTVVDMKTQKKVFGRCLNSENAGIFDPGTKIYYGQDNSRLIRIDVNKLDVTFDTFPPVPHGMYQFKLVFNDAGQLAVQDDYDIELVQNVGSPDEMVIYHVLKGEHYKPTPLQVTGASDINHQAESCFGLAVSPDNRYVLMSGYTKALLLDFDPRRNDTVAVDGSYPGVFIPMKYHRRQRSSCWDS